MALWGRKSETLAGPGQQSGTTMGFQAAASPPTSPIAVTTLTLTLFNTFRARPPFVYKPGPAKACFIAAGRSTFLGIKLLLTEQTSYRGSGKTVFWRLR